MGFLDQVLNALGKVVNVVMYAAGTVTGIAVAGVVEFTQVAIEKFGEYRARNRNTNLGLANKPLHKLTSELNNEIDDLERKQRRDRVLNRHDEERLKDLYARRDRTKDDMRTNSELLMVERIQNGQGVYDSIHIDDSTTHILQFHVGQTVFGKRCRRCGRPMMLQWKQGMRTVAMSDFFWGCIGFYEGVRHHEPFLQSDMDLFTRVDRPEFEITTDHLSTIISMPAPKQNVTKRMRDIRQEVTDVYLCPIHNEPMIVREKKDADGLLDQFFFGCPRWSHTHGGCNQIVKLKSPAQLASALEAFYGRGIL